MNDETTSRTARRERSRAKRARRARFRARTETVHDREALVDEIVAKLNPVALRVAELSATFDHGDNSAAREAAANQITRGNGAWRTSSELGKTSIPLSTEVIEAMASAYGVPAWFLINTGEDAQWEIELEHELRLYRASRLRVAGYGPHDCPPDPVVDHTDADTLRTAAGRALTDNLFAHLGSGVIMLIFFAMAVLVGIASVIAFNWLGAFILTLILVVCIVNIRAWVRELRAILAARKLSPGQFSHLVQRKLQRHIGATLHRQLQAPTARPYIHPILCHGAPISYTTLTHLTPQPHTLLRAILPI